MKQSLFKKISAVELRSLRLAQGIETRTQLFHKQANILSLVEINGSRLVLESQTSQTCLRLQLEWA